MKCRFGRFPCRQSHLLTSARATCVQVSYFYDADIGNYYYGPGHPMKPHRIRMTHSLLLHYDLYQHMKALIPVAAEATDMTPFHKHEFIEFLSQVRPLSFHPHGNAPPHRSNQPLPPEVGLI